jgi:hypothetical protein
VENLKLILAVALLVLYGAKRVVQKLSKVETKSWYKESETIGFIVAEVILLAESVQGLLG